MYYWRKLKVDVYEHVKRREVHQKCKGEHAKSPGLFQPLPIPKKVCQDITIDFIEGLPKSQDISVVMVVVERLSKYAHFICLKHPYTEASVAHALLENIYKLHGLPQTIVINRDVVFMTKLWQSLFDVQSVQLHHSTAYHPQFGGQTEAVNKCLEGYLRCICNDRPKDWIYWISLAGWWYNTTYHSSTKLTPFEILHGQKPQSKYLMFLIAPWWMKFT